MLAPMCIYIICICEIYTMFQYEATKQQRFVILCITIYSLCILIVCDHFGILKTYNGYEDDHIFIYVNPQPLIILVHLFKFNIQVEVH